MMAGQTQREGPWESNLGLEPEWDGAFGLWELLIIIDEQILIIASPVSNA